MSTERTIVHEKAMEQENGKVGASPIEDRGQRIRRSEGKKVRRAERRRTMDEGRWMMEDRGQRTEDKKVRR
jgi:hypothetical protein